MRCFGEYIDDRVCDLCQLTLSCRMEFNKKEEDQKKITNMADSLLSNHFGERVK